MNQFLLTSTYSYPKLCVYLLSSRVVGVILYIISEKITISYSTYLHTNEDRYLAACSMLVAFLPA